MPLQVEPPPGLPSLDVLHPEVAALMRRCFVDGHRDPAKRPAPSDWERTLVVAERALVRCRHGHYYGGHLASCTWCGMIRERRAGARPRAASEAREGSGRMAIPIAPAGPPRSAPLPPKPAAGGHAWRNAIMVTVAAILILSMVTTNVLGLRPAPLRSNPLPTSGVEESQEPLPPEERGAVRRDDTVPLQFEIGDRVRVVGEVATSSLFVYEAPDWQSERVGNVANGSVVQITGNSEVGVDGIWWPIFDPLTGALGYIWQRFLAE
jgi:hypothetical protein